MTDRPVVLKVKELYCVFVSTGSAYVGYLADGEVQQYQTQRAAATRRSQGQGLSESVPVTAFLSLRVIVA